MRKPCRPVAPPLYEEQRPALELPPPPERKKKPPEGEPSGGVIVIDLW